MFRFQDRLELPWFNCQRETPINSMIKPWDRLLWHRSWTTWSTGYIQGWVQRSPLSTISSIRSNRPWTTLSAVCIDRISCSARRWARFPNTIYVASAQEGGVMFLLRYFLFVDLFCSQTRAWLKAGNRDAVFFKLFLCVLFLFLSESNLRVVRLQTRNRYTVDTAVILFVGVCVCFWCATVCGRGVGAARSCAKRASSTPCPPTATVEPCINPETSALLLY